MPLYEFNCSACDLNCEVQAAIAKRDDVACPNCGRKDFMIRLFNSAPAVQYSYPAGHARAGRGGTGRVRE